MTRDETTERIDALEIIVAEQQQAIDDLSEMISKQWQANEVQKRQLAKMTDQIQDLEENQPAPPNQKAPHY
jgi:SlyX protein